MDLDTAIRNFNQGNFEGARKLCEKVLSQDPENTSALSLLGGCLARTGKIPEAIQVMEKVCALCPGDAGFYSNLSQLHSLAGNFQKAVLLMAHAVVSDPANDVHQAGFARLIEHMEFYQLAPETAVIREAIRICLANAKLDAGSFSTAWHSLLLLDPVFMNLATLVRGTAFNEQAEKIELADLEEPLSEPFFLMGIRSLHAVDERLERILTFLRRLFLVRFDEIDPPRFLPFLCALAEHCMLNEYVYSCTEEELERVGALEAGLDLADEINESAMAAVALVYCYGDSMPLDTELVWVNAGADSQHAAFGRLTENIVSLNATVEEFGEAIPALASASGFASHDVSASVARQYAENPYPRWRHLDIPVLNEAHNAKGRGKKILVAGCGTGFEPLNLAVHYPEASILGVDLSLPSLAYGKNKAIEFGIKNVEFMQADILDLENLEQTFDLVTSVGVLHHMENPVEGWRILINCLKPDGLMKIGLYSDLARESVTLCKNWIAEQGYEATPEGMRAFRQSIMDLDEENPLRDIMKWTDFYSMSMCRDLVFHVQEQFVTLPWLKSTLDELGLTCLLMKIGNPAFRKEYLSKFPGDRAMNNLDSLHQYELQNPRTFRDMYQFWCCRKDSSSARRPPAWFYTAGI